MHTIPTPPESLSEAGLSEEFVAGLLLKALHVRGAVLGFDLSDLLALPLALLDPVLQRLQERRFLEVMETRGPGRGEYVFKLTDTGRKQALEELEICRYVGPAPVTMDDFRRWVEVQNLERVTVTEDEIRSALDGMVLADDVLQKLGPAVNSGRSLFLFGDSGNGKTLLAERIARVFGDRYFVPHAVLVDGTVMVVHDPVHHSRAEDEPVVDKDAEAFSPGDTEIDPSAQPVAGEEAGSLRDPGESGDLSAPEGPGPDGPRREDPVADEVAVEPPPGLFREVPLHDARYVEASRPVVVTGGELTLDQLDLQWDPVGRMYQAPPQLKAAGGVLVVDDLGRQRVEVRDLLNRWVVPLERRRDYLTLRSGRKLVVPFDCFVVFSTNLEPRELADEAFLRRIQYKIQVPDPGREEYSRIFRDCCDERSIEYLDDAVTHLFDRFYSNGIEPRACHPRDILDHLDALASFRGEPASLENGLLDLACESYFLPH